MLMQNKTTFYTCQPLDMNYFYDRIHKMKLKTIDTAPEDVKIILYWDKLDHFEDGTIELFEGKLVHWLYDGETLSIEPSHWCEVPKL